MSLARRSQATLSIALLISVLLVTMTATGVGQTPNVSPGGWVEKQGKTTRPRFTASQIQSFVPQTRGAFTFPAPYSTQAIRITDASDCRGQDCVNAVGYSYWRNSNAHEGSNTNTMWIFVGLGTSK